MPFEYFLDGRDSTKVQVGINKIYLSGETVGTEMIIVPFRYYFR